MKSPTVAYPHSALAYCPGWMDTFAQSIGITTILSLQAGLSTQKLRRLDTVLCCTLSQNTRIYPNLHFGIPLASIGKLSFFGFPIESEAIFGIG